MISAKVKCDETDPSLIFVYSFNYLKWSESEKCSPRDYWSPKEIYITVIQRCLSDEYVIELVR